MIALRPYQPGDIDHFVGLFTDGEVSGFVGGPKSDADARALFESLISGAHARAVCALAVTEAGVMIGHAVLFRTDDEDALELGYMIERASWGRGIGTATARALLGEVRARGARFALGTVDTDNHASRRILEKIGGQGTLETDDDGEFWSYRIPLG